MMKASYQVVKTNNQRKQMALERQSSFAIWKSSEENHLYSVHYTHFIQE